MARKPAADEIALFREAVADAVPLVSDRVHHEPPQPRPIPRQRRRDEAAALAETLAPAPLEIVLEGGDELAYLKPGLPRTLLRDLRRGRWVTQDQLDLHGLNRIDAREMLAQFVADSLAHGRRCLRIIHGKGLRSPGREPVLKELVRNWLANRPEVLAYCQARAADGGAGAVTVLLKAER
ncbi:putative DNA endonuclease SmrA [mine drainage metagenome]|uniref:Putative DNA endonuclease SmrA n=1 Tax=mine drainage metagenome TaxID=410659 RepID=A0A1J5SAL7_9ZZZZ